MEKLARSLSVMYWDMIFPEEWLCSLTVKAPKVVGATCLTKLRPIAGPCAVRKVLGYVSTAVRKCADGVCAEGTRRCWFVLAAASSRTITSMAEGSCSGAVGRKEGIGSRGSSSSPQGNEITRCEPVFDGLDCCDLEWKLHESTCGNGPVEQSPNEQRFASRSARIPSHLHNDHGTGTARFDQKPEISETDLETTSCCLRFAMRAMSYWLLRRLL